MEELRSLVSRAQAGDLDAYGEIVRRFQDMAYGYAYSILGDFHLAEDAAQEAFIRAYGDLGKLDDPAAFPGWFRRIVFKQCDRLTRRKRLPTTPLESARPIASGSPGPVEKVEEREMADRVLKAIRSLPENERTITTLFYINGYSQKDIAEFLEVPVTTVNNRLHASRKRLKERLLATVADGLRQSRPGPEFVEKVMVEMDKKSEAPSAFRPLQEAFERIGKDRNTRRDELAEAPWDAMANYSDCEFFRALFLVLLGRPAAVDDEKTRLARLKAGHSRKDLFLEVFDSYEYRMRQLQKLASTLKKGPPGDGGAGESF